MILMDQAYVTLAVRDAYAIGCLVLGKALRILNTTRCLVVIVTNELSLEMRDLLSKVYDEIIEVPIISGSDFRIGRPDLSQLLTKIECWNLTKYSKCVFLDCDTLVIQNCDELFEMEELSAVPDTGWPDCFNTGVFVYKPSKSTYDALIALARSKGSFDGGDQGLLNSFFGKDWMADLSKRLSFVYNVVVGYVYTYIPAYKQFGGMTKIARFSGHPKPWFAQWNYSSGNFISDANTQQPFLQIWLDTFRDTVYGQLPEMYHELAKTGNVNTIWNLLQASKPSEDYFKSEKTTPQSFELFTTPQPSQLLTTPQPFQLFTTPQPFELHTTPSPLSPPPAAFPIPYRQSWQEFQPPQYSDQIKAEIHSDSTSPIRPSISQIHHSTSPIRDFPFPELGSPRSRGKSESHITGENKPYSQIQQQLPPPPPKPRSLSTNEWDKPGPSKVDTAPSVRPKTKKRMTEKEEKSRKSTSSRQEEKLPPWTNVKPGRMKAWEEGNIDYMGKDKFENIQKKLDALLQESQPEPEVESKGALHFERSLSVTDTSALKFAQPTMEEVPDVPELPLQSVESQTSTVDLPGYQINDFSAMYDWESGRIDYTGRDSSDNIMRRLDFLLSHPSELKRKQ